MFITAFDAVIFDCDGVLVDSENITNKLVTNSLVELGFDIPNSVTATFVGMPLQRIIDRVETHVGRSLPTGWRECYERDRDIVLRRELKAIPGVEIALERLQSCRIPIGVASGADRRKVLLALDVSNLRRYFGSAIVCGSDVVHNKPSPDVFVRAATCLNASPARCVAVEDSPTGVMAAVAASMIVLGYCATADPTTLLSAGAITTFSTMDSLPTLLGL